MMFLKLFRFSYFILLFALFFTTSLKAQETNYPQKISPQVQAYAVQFRNVPVLIYFKQAVLQRTSDMDSRQAKAGFVHSALQAHAQKSQKNAISFLRSSDADYQSFYIVNAIATTLDKSGIEYFYGLNEVAYIALDTPVKLDRPVESQSAGAFNAEPEWGIQVIKADKVWGKGIRGEGVVIGGQDTGYEWTHPAIKGKYRGFKEDGTVTHDYNWHDAIHDISPLNNDTLVLPGNNPCGLDVKFPCDDGSHGTHTMGTMVGEDSLNIIGVAPRAQWIGCRNMERGWGKPSTYIECFEWFLAPTDLDGLNPDPNMAPHVINNSWYCPEQEGCDPGNWVFMETAIQNLRNAGVFVVVSAGNSGNACGRINAPPAMFENSFAVGATTIQDTLNGQFIDVIAGYSSWGPVTVDSSNRLKPDISAPGSGVRSSVPPAGYASFSGTSMAGPHVAGVVALVISANPALAGKVDEIQDILQLTADPMFRQDTCGTYFATDSPNFVYGYGRINALEAVNMALNLVDSKDVVKPDFQISLSPNPAQNTLKINWSAPQEWANIKITDQRGSAYNALNIQNNGRIDISGLPQGVYILKVNLEGNMVVRQFIKL
jgi:serine protease AprX